MGTVPCIRSGFPTALARGEESSAVKDAGIPITLIVAGLAWLAWRLAWFPDFDWIIAVGLVAGGVAIMVLDGLTKSSVVIGPFLMGVGIAWGAHERYRVHWSVLVPVLLVLLGVLMLVARNPRFPERRSRDNRSE